MPKVTEAHTEARRQQILLAACICMSKKGFRQTSMQEICRTAGLSPGAVYAYFPGKEDILRTLAEEGLQHSGKLLEDLAAARELRPAVRRLVEFLMECDRRTEEHAPPELDLNRLKVGLWAEAVQDAKIRELFEEQSRVLLDHMAGLVERAQRGGEVRPGPDPASVARVIGSLWDGLVLQRAIEPDMDVTGYIEAMFALLEGTLWGEAADGRRP